MSFLAGGAVIAWIAAAPSLNLPLVGELADWQMAFIITGAPGLLLAPIALLASDARRGASGKGSTAGFSDLWRHMRRYPGFVITHNLAFACIQALIVGLQSWNAAYIFRTFGWPVSKIGVVLGAVQLVTALAGLAFHGWVVDWLFSRGRKDAHLHYFMVMMLLTLPCAVSAYMVPNAIAMIALYDLAYFFVMAGASVGPAALQMATPNDLRGNASAICMVVLALIGVILGPVFVASLTTFVFADEALLGYAMALFSFLACGVAAALFALGRSRMRRIVTDMLDV
jgi:MFS family permease